MFDKLPIELFTYHIFPYLELRDIASLRKVCKYMSYIPIRNEHYHKDILAKIDLIHKEYGEGEVSLAEGIYNFYDNDYLKDKGIIINYDLPRHYYNIRPKGAVKMHGGYGIIPIKQVNDMKWFLKYFLQDVKYQANEFEMPLMMDQGYYITINLTQGVILKRLMIWNSDQNEELTFSQLLDEWFWRCGNRDSEYHFICTKDYAKNYICKCSDCYTYDSNSSDSSSESSSS